MKINLLEKNFDLNKLLCEIHAFEMFSGKYPDYAVMSERTEEALESRYRIFYVENNVYYKNNKRYIGEIFGIPIAYNDKLQFGVVDIV